MNTNKRRLTETSPGGGLESVTVGEMSVNDLMVLMQGSIAKTIDEKLTTLPTKDDFEKITTKVEDVSEKLNSLTTENQMLKEKIRSLEEAKGMTDRRMIILEDSIKRKNIIIRGIESQQSVYKAVQNLFTQILKMKSFDIVSTRKIFEKDNKMTVIAELKNEKMVADVLKNTKNLAGSNIFIEVDLNCDRLQHKKIMLQLKHEILKINKSKKVLVRNDKIKVGERWLHWDNKNMLIYNKESAEKILNEIYGEDGAKIDINYNSLLKKLISKN